MNGRMHPLVVVVAIVSGAWGCAAPARGSVATVEPAPPGEGEPAVEPASTLTAEELFGEQALPYLGFGAVWIRPDGLILVETGDGGGFAFRAKVSLLNLIEQDGKVSFQNAAGDSKLIHRFADQPVANGHACSAVFRHVGDLWLDYIEEDQRLVVSVEGGKRSFAAEFDFRDSIAPVPPPTDQTPEEIAGDSTCECSCGGENDQFCSASKTCSPGYQCSCHCDCSGDQARCRCSSCVRERRQEADIIVADPIK